MSIKMLCLLFYHHDDYHFLSSSGSVHQILDGHFHYVQGVAWDPLSKYVASLSSDRTCRIYVNKPQAKAKGVEKLNYICQHTIVKAEQQPIDDAKVRKYLLCYFLYSTWICHL